MDSTGSSHGKVLSSDERSAARAPSQDGVTTSAERPSRAISAALSPIGLNPDSSSTPSVSRKE